MRANHTRMHGSASLVPRASAREVATSTSSGPLPSSEWWVRYNLPCLGGAQLAVNVTLVSALCTGEPQPHAAEVDGVVLERDTSRRRCVGAMLIGRLRHGDGGRWSEEAVHMVLATLRAPDVPRA